MAVEAVCKNKSAALLILETITETIKSDTQRAALKAVAAWIVENIRGDEIMNMTYEERQQWVKDYYENDRRLKTLEERKKLAAFYLDNIISKKKFDAMSEKEQVAFLRDGGLVEGYG